MYWLRWIRTRAVSDIAARLPGIIASLHPVEQATVLVLANGMIAASSSIHGRILAADPAKAGFATVSAALLDLLPRRDAVTAIAKDRKSPHRRHAAVDLHATELAILTIGTGLDPDCRQACREAWKAAWAGKPRLADAAAWIRRYEVEAGVRALPVGGTVREGTAGLVSVGAKVPPFLVGRRAA